MAEAVIAAENTEAAPAGGKKKKKLFIIILVVVLLVVIGGGAAAFLLLKPAKHAKKTDAEAEAHAEEEDIKKHPPVFIPLDNFVVNLNGNEEHYLQIGITLEAKDAKAEEALKSFMPAIRSKILMLLSSKTADELHSVEGKRKLASEVLEIAREPANKELKTGIRNVHFSSFVIQ